MRTHNSYASQMYGRYQYFESELSLYRVKIVTNNRLNLINFVF